MGTDQMVVRIENRGVDGTEDKGNLVVYGKINARDGSIQEIGTPREGPQELSANDPKSMLEEETG